MNFPSLSVKRPVLTTVVFIIILLLGIISLSKLPLELLPDMSFPALSIVTTYEGAGPEEIETAVTKILEGAVATVPNIKNIFSTSVEGVSAITIEFEWGTDIDDAANDIRDKIDFIRDFLPDEASKPILFKFSTSFMPVLMFGIKAKESYHNLIDILKDKVIDPLRQVEGVGDASLFGGLIREIRVEINQVKLNSFRLSVDQIIHTIRMNNVSEPGGTLKIGKNEFILRLRSEYRDINEIKNLIVGNYKGTPIYLKDVANVVDSFKEENMIVRVNGEPGAMIFVQKQSRANTVEVAEKCKQRIEQLKKRLPDDIEIYITFDSSRFIGDSLNNLTRTILWGGFFVLIVVFLFLIDWRASIIIGLTIPFSLIVAFIFLYFLGYTINIMSLSSLAIAIGMVVDNGIVVTENIYRHRFQEKLALNKSAVRGAGEVLQAVTASTLTTVAIFIPIFFISGIVGLLFKQLGLAVIVVLLSSLFVSLTLTPMLASRLFDKKPASSFFVKAERINFQIFNKIKENYTKILKWALSHRKIIVFIAIGVFIFSLMLLGFIGKEFMPAADEGFIRGAIELESGTKIEITDRVMAKIEKIVAKYIPETETIIVRSGRSPQGLAIAFGREEGANIGFIALRLKEKGKRKRSSQEIADMLTKMIKKIPGIKNIDLETSGGSRMFGVGKPVSIEIYGHDIEKTTKFARRIKKILESIKGTRNVIISSKPGKPEIRVNIDKAKAQMYGLSLYQIANVIKSSFAGTTASVYRAAGKEYDIFVILQRAHRQSLDNIKNTMIRTPAGKLISLANIAEFSIKKGPKSITRKNRARMLTVDCEIYKRPISAIIKDFEKKMKDIPIPEGIRYEYGGEIEQQRSSFIILIEALILGILLIYLIMAGQFESFLDPFIIMFSVPFAIVGVIWALFLTGVTLNVNSFVGMIMLVGIVVNNGIVLIDYINQLRRKYGKNLIEAVITGSSIRLRPVLMTAFTTIFGLLPMALARAEGSETWVPLGVSVIGGLLVSTLVTLVLIPTIYTIFEHKIKK